MSITSARNFFEKSGCGTIAIVVVGITMVFGFLYGRGGGNNQQDGSTEDKSPALVMVGQYKVTDAQVRNYADQIIAQQGQSSETGLSADETASIYASVLISNLGNLLLNDLAASQGISVSDDQILEAAKTEIEAQISSAISQLKMMNRISATATPAQIDAAFKEQFKMTVGEAREQMLNQKKQELANPDARLAAATRQLSEKLKAAAANKITVSDDELKQSFNTYVTKRIVFGSAKVTPKDQLDKANKVLAELKGGLSFEAAMNKYSEDPAPAANKPKSESTTDLPQSIIDYDPSYSSLPKLKPGQFTDVVVTSAGPTIIKLIKVESKIPGDFNTRKKDYMKVEVERRADRKVRDDLIKLRDSDKIVWKSNSAEALYLWNLSQNDIMYSADKVKKKELLLKALAAVQKTKDSGDEADNKWQILADYVIHKTLVDMTQGDEQKKYRDGLIEAMVALPNIIETPGIRLDLVKIYLDRKDKQAGAELLAAAQNNTTTGEQAQAFFNRINGLRPTLKAAGLLAADEDKKIGEELDRWKKDMALDLVSRVESLFDYSTQDLNMYDAILVDLKKYEAQGWMNPEDKKSFDAGVKKWKDGAFKGLMDLLKSNTDYSDGGEITWREHNGIIERFKKLGFITDAQAGELQAQQQNWKKENAAAKAKEKAEAAKKPAASTTGTTGGTPPSTSTTGLTGLSGTTGTTGR